MSHMQFFKMNPIDTLFFRDGRPFNSNESITLSNVMSMFPPSPATIAGAILAQYAKKIGWDGKTKWDNTVCDLLGKGDDIKLQFTGMFVKKGRQFLFPCPQHIVQLLKNDSNDFLGITFLNPSKQTFVTDQGEIYLPELPNDAVVINDQGEVDIADNKGNLRIKPLQDYWISQDGLIASLNDPQRVKCNHLFKNVDLFDIEERVGIARDELTHATLQGMLYSTSHIRLKHNTDLIIGVENAPDIEIDGMLQLGGESRFAEIKRETTFTNNFTNKGNLIYIASPTLLSHFKSDDIKTACIPKLQKFGGWDGMKNKPRALKTFLPPGSVLFMNTTISMESFQAQRRQKNDEFQQHNYGYNQIYLGKY